jgi:hypothetical protein
MSTDVIKKETKQQITRREADEAHAVHTQIVAAIRDGQAAAWRLAEALYEFSELRGYKPLDYDSMDDYLGSPEIALERTFAWRLIKSWRTFAIERKVERERLETLAPTKAYRVLPALDAGRVTTEDAISDVWKLCPKAT